MALVGRIDGRLSSDDICPNNMNNGEVYSGEPKQYSLGCLILRCLEGSLSRYTSESMFGYFFIDSGAAFHATGDSGISRNNMNNGEVDGGEHISVVRHYYYYSRILQKYKNKLKHYEDIRKGNREMAIDVHPLFVDSGAGLSSVSGCDPAAADNATQTPKNTPHQPIWLIDCGAAFHATGDQSLLTDFTPLPGDHTIRVPHKGRMQVHGIGSVNTPNVVLQNVRYVPDLGINLISVGQLAKLGYKVSTGDYGCRISKGSDDNVVGKARFTDDFQFEVEFVKVPPSAN